MYNAFSICVISAGYMVSLADLPLKWPNSQVLISNVREIKFIFKMANLFHPRIQ